VTSDRWKEVKGVFAAALDRPVSERAAYLDEACAGDEELRREVESLLASHQQAGEFIESPAIPTDTQMLDEDEEDADLGRRIGAYRIEKEIGRGGMGSVYLAVRADEEFERQVAIKLIRRGMELDFIVRRFRNERQILANLDHPYIARLLDGGSTEDGLPYFIMEYVDGQPMHRYAENLNLPADERLKLFVKVCEAVQYAHDHQVVHRDLKPANILVTAAGVPKLLDFGIAKLLDPEISPQPTEATTGGFRMMTPAYASPEQLRGEYATAASDIYSLGVLLFELLTGRRPERLRRPAHESQTGSTGNLAGNLASIVAKATQEEPEARYASVEGLAADVIRHLEGHPVSALPFFLDDRAASADLPPSGPNSIAILPFQTLGVENKTDEYLGVGMADALITKLSNIRRIQVRPTSSVLKYSQGSHDPLTAARELDVHYVLEGRIRRAGERVRVTVQMLRGRDGASLWAGKFDERFTDILNLEDSLSEQLAQALVERLTEEERDLLRKRGTDNPKAYQAYLKGRYYWNSLTEEGLSKALVAFSEALTLDPRFAHAQAGLADYYNWLGVWSVLPPKECYAAAKDAALKALDLDPALAEAHAAHAFVCWIHDRDWEAAERGFERAIELNPDYAPAHQWHSYMLSSLGRHDEAMASMQRALSLDPLSPMMGIVGAFISYNARRVDRALEQAQRALRIDPRHFMAHDIFAWAHSQKKMHEEALASAEKALTLAPGDPVALWTMALTLASAGRRPEARATLQQIMELSQSRYISAYYIAVIHAVLGDREAALDWLEKGFENGDSWMVWMAVEPRLDDLRTEPRFARLEQGMRLRGDVEGQAPLQAAATTSPAGGSTARRSYLWAYALAIVAAAVFLGIIGESLFTKGRAPFQNIKITRLRTNGNARSAAISPDGRYVAYTLDEGGREAIWMRQAAVTAGVRVLPPTGASYRSLTFSRDGAYLYYVAYEANDFEHGAIYQVPSLGGQPKKLVPDVMSAISLSPDGGHAAFLRSDQIAGRDDLILASLQGDGERRLAFRKHPDRFGYASAPAWSPDGKSIAAVIEKSDSQGHYSNLITIRVDDGQQKELSSQRWQFVEKIVWLGDGAGVLAIAQDVDSTFQQIWEVLLRGEARKITNDLTDYVGLSLTADSRQLTSLQFQTLANIWVAPDGNADHAIQIVPGAGRYYDLAWTRDGKILYSSDASDTVDLWVREADGSGAKQLTSGGRRNYSPAVSPDGKYVVFHSNRTGNWNVWRMDTDGGNLKALTHDNTDGSNWPQVSLDGSWVIFHHRTQTGAGLHLWKTPIDGGNPTEITQESCWRPAVSPADGKIACWYTEDTAKPHWRIGVFPPGGGPPLETFEFAPSVSIDSSTHWTPDGRAIAYVDNRGGASNLWTQPLDGSRPRPLTSFKAAQILSFAWSRDGKLAFSRGILSSDVVLITDVK
jgi:serine/threonine protein kinase/Tol biopolymer transport system component/tetratricopeptide (TPR) repeat protein